MLTQMIMQVSTVHQVEYKTQFVSRVKGVGHADDEGAVDTRADQREHYPFVQRQRFALFHFYPFLIEAFHRVHFPRVCLPATVNFAEAPSADYPVNAEVVHC